MKKLHFDLDLQSVIIEHRRERVDPDVVGNFVIGLRLAKERLTKAIQNVGTAQVLCHAPTRPCRPRSQARFAALFRVEVSTLRNWEQGRRELTGPAKALLYAIRKEPTNVLKALAA